MLKNLKTTPLNSQVTKRCNKMQERKNNNNNTMAQICHIIKEKSWKTIKLSKKIRKIS